MVHLHRVHSSTQAHIPYPPRRGKEPLLRHRWCYPPAASSVASSFPVPTPTGRGTQLITTPPPQSPSRSSTSSSSSWRRRKNPATYKYTPPHPHADLTAAALPSSSPLATSPRLNPPKPTVPSRRRGSARWWWGRCTSTTSGCRRRWRMRRHGSPRRSPARWGRRGRRGDPTTRTPPTPRSSGSPSSTCKNLSLSLPSPSPPPSVLFVFSRLRRWRRRVFLGPGGVAISCFLIGARRDEE